MGPEAIDWGLFGLFMWALFALMPRRRRARWGGRMMAPPHYAPPPGPPPPPPTVPGPATAPAQRLPVDVQLKVEQIKRKVEFLLQHAGQLPALSSNLYVLQRTKSDYLPATLEAYLALPAGLADTAKAPDGRTALEVLKDQLNLLDLKLDEIAEDIQRDNLDRLLANGRFLEDRFGKDSSPRPGGGQVGS